MGICGDHLMRETGRGNPRICLGGRPRALSWYKPLTRIAARDSNYPDAGVTLEGFAPG
jgi:hypothetical protein